MKSIICLLMLIFCLPDYALSLTPAARRAQSRAKKAAETRSVIKGNTYNTNQDIQAKRQEKKAEKAQAIMADKCTGGMQYVMGKGCQCSNPNKELVNGTCKNKCGAGKSRASDGTCACSNAGQEEIGGQCVAKCNTGETRVNGKCEISCNANQEKIGQDCLDKCGTNEERNTAKACVCKATFEMINGACSIPGCDAGEEKVGQECLTSCGTNEERNTAKACVCKATFEMIDGACSTPTTVTCADNEVKVGGVCTACQLLALPHDVEAGTCKCENNDAIVQAGIPRACKLIPELDGLVDGGTDGTVDGTVDGGTDGAVDGGTDGTVETTYSVKYGHGSSWNTLSLPASSITCGNAVFGDPLFGVAKFCYVGSTYAAAEGESFTPGVASTYKREIVISASQVACEAATGTWNESESMCSCNSFTIWVASSKTCEECKLPGTVKEGNICKCTGIYTQRFSNYKCNRPTIDRDGDDIGNDDILYEKQIER